MKHILLLLFFPISLSASPEDSAAYKWKVTFMPFLSSFYGYRFTDPNTFKENEEFTQLSAQIMLEYNVDDHFSVSGTVSNNTIGFKTMRYRQSVSSSVFADYYYKTFFFISPAVQVHYRFGLGEKKNISLGAGLFAAFNYLNMQNIYTSSTDASYRYPFSEIKFRNLYGALASARINILDKRNITSGIFYEHRVCFNPLYEIKQYHYIQRIRFQQTGLFVSYMF